MRHLIDAGGPSRRLLCRQGASLGWPGKLRLVLMGGCAWAPQQQDGVMVPGWAGRSYSLLIAQLQASYCLVLDGHRPAPYVPSSAWQLQGSCVVPRQVVVVHAGGEWCWCPGCQIATQKCILAGRISLRSWRSCVQCAPCGAGIRPPGHPAVDDDVWCALSLLIR
jgi:hypothetical protein